MNDFDLNISACHQCPERQRPCSGRCPCTIDDVDIRDHAKAGLCPKGFYGPGKVARLVAGAVGLFKAKAGIDLAPEDVQRQRAELCAGCENVVKAEGAIVSCKVCGCGLIGKKLAIAGERCPVDRWGAHSGNAHNTASNPT